ncbi:MAG: hypothetical protein IM618_09600 [Cytophagales bacterium]|nr:hypothetical protein [Cytophagales bacterium]MCA6383880.1 hypothetical protein [Cytophagales bacterium]
MDSHPPEADGGAKGKRKYRRKLGAVACLPARQAQVVRALDSYPPVADGGSKGKDEEIE